MGGGWVNRKNPGLTMLFWCGPGQRPYLIGGVDMGTRKDPGGDWLNAKAVGQTATVLYSLTLYVAYST